MNQRGEFIVDFIARPSSTDEWKMVLVEQGPWEPPIEEHLKRIQRRLYDCIDAAVDGQMAEKFPESNGKPILIRLDCYDVPEDDVKDFFGRFSEGVFEIGDYKAALVESRFVAGIAFEVNFDSVDPPNEEELL